MEFLPYGRARPGTWSGSMVLSVSAHAAMAVGLVTLYTAQPLPPPAEDRTAFTVTVEELDSETLDGTTEEAELDPETPEAIPDAGVTETDAVERIDGADAEAAALAEAEALEGAEVESLAGAEVETLAGAELEAVAGVEVESLEPEPEDVPAETTEAADLAGAAALAPEGVEAVAMDGAATALASTVLEPVAPVSPVAPTAELSPVVPDAPASPLIGDGPAPVSPVAGGGAAAVAPVASGAVTATVDAAAVARIAAAAAEREAVAPAAAEAERVAAVSTSRADPPAPPRAPAPSRAPTARDLALGDLIGRLRAAPPGEGCLVAIPRRDGETGVGLDMVSASEAAMEALAQAVLGPEDADVRQRRVVVDARQCAALDYVEATADYPATAMGIRIDETEIASGGNLTGVLRGSAGRRLTLLLVDDNGVVQDLGRFLSFSGNLVRFDVPVTRAGGARETRQILLAIATTGRPTALEERIGRLAADVFPGLPDALGAGADIGVATFDVR